MNNDSVLQSLMERIEALKESFRCITDDNSLLEQQTDSQMLQIIQLESDKIKTQNDIKLIADKVEELMNKDVKIKSRLSV